MYTIRHTLLGNIRALFNVPNTQDKAPVQAETPEQKILKTLEQIKAEATLAKITPEVTLPRYKNAIQNAYPNDFGKQLDAVVKNE